MRIRLGHRERFWLWQSLGAAVFVGWPLLLVAIERHISIPWIAAFVGHLILLTLGETLVVPKYFRAQAPSTSTQPSTVADLPRVFAASLLARAITVLGAVLGAALPILWTLITHQAHDLAIGIGVLAGLFFAATITSYVTRAALVERLRPFAALRRSLSLTRTRPITTITATAIICGCHWFALAGLQHLALFMGLAIVARWLRDIWLTTKMTSSSLLGLVSFMFDGTAALTLPSKQQQQQQHLSRPRFGGRAAALAAVLLFILATVRAGDAQAQVALIGADGNPATSAGALVTPQTTTPVDDASKTELVEAQNKKLFDQANAALVEAQAASDKATEDLVRFRASVVGAPFHLRPSSSEIAAKDAALIKAADAADALVSQRKAALAEAKQRILDQANGGESFGSLDRNLIDIKNTGSFLKGMGVGTLTGVADTGRAIGRLAQHASAKLFGTAPPPVEPEGPKLSTSEQRLADNQRDLAIDLLRIRDGASANRILGEGAGSEIIATAVTAEVGGAVISRAGAALRSGSAAESSLLRNFGAGGESVALKAKGKTWVLKDGRTALGPETAASGRGVNLTSDNGLVLTEGSFTVGAHATANSLTFYTDVAGAATLSTRTVAVRMWKAGYRGGDVKLIACESACNPGLINGLRSDLNTLALERPVGTITAPTTTVNGLGEFTGPNGAWKLFN